jgi:site-specific recombinase XerD
MDNSLDFIKDLSPETIAKLAMLFQAVNNKPVIAITVRQFKLEYIAFMRDKGFSAAYIKNTEFTLGKVVDYFGPARNLSDIDFREGEQFIDHLGKTAPRGIHVYLRNCKALFSKALSWNYVRENIFTKIKLARLHQTNPEWITEEELTCICSNIGNRNIRQMAQFSFYCGARLGEIVSIKWSDIDLKERNIHIGKSHKTKSGKERVVPICNPLFEILFQRYENYKKGKIIELESSYVFQKRNGRNAYKPEFISRKFMEGRRAAKLSEGIHFHTLRHSNASYLVKKGVSLFVIRELLGHADIKTTQIYSHLNNEDLRNAINCFNK